MTVGSGSVRVSELISEADLVEVPDAARDPTAKLSLGAVCWAIFEGARNPYVILITIYRSEERRVGKECQ